MKYNNIILLLALCTTNSFAAGAPVPYTFTAGDMIRASDINANFQELANRIDAQQSSGGKLYIFSTPISYAADTGRKAFSSHCENIDPSATMCTVNRVRNAQATLGVSYDSQFQGGWVDYWTGLDNTTDNCIGWNTVNSPSNTFKGGYMNIKGSLTAGICSSLYPVSCCK